MALWDDLGPASQGKIITAVLKGDWDTARELLHRWSASDLETLGRACELLAVFARDERARRPM